MAFRWSWGEGEVPTPRGQDQQCQRGPRLKAPAENPAAVCPSLPFLPQALYPAVKVSDDHRLSAAREHAGQRLDIRPHPSRTRCCPPRPFVRDRRSLGAEAGGQSSGIRRQRGRARLCPLPLASSQYSLLHRRLRRPPCCGCARLPLRCIGPRLRAACRNPVWCEQRC